MLSHKPKAARDIPGGAADCRKCPIGAMVDAVSTGMGAGPVMAPALAL